VTALLIDKIKMTLFGQKRIAFPTDKLFPTRMVKVVQFNITILQSLKELWVMDCTTHFRLS